VQNFNHPIRRFTRNTVILLIVLGMIGAIILEKQTHILQKTIDDRVYDNRGHYLSCEELPPLSDVERIVAENHSLIQAIEQVNPGFIFVTINSPCPGKGELIFEYPSHQNRLQIEALIGGETFFGIPYRMINN